MLYIEQIAKAVSALANMEDRTEEAETAILQLKHASNDYFTGLDAYGTLYHMLNSIACRYGNGEIKKED